MESPPVFILFTIVVCFCLQISFCKDVKPLRTYSFQHLNGPATGCRQELPLSMNEPVNVHMTVTHEESEYADSCKWMLKTDEGGQILIDVIQSEIQSSKTVNNPKNNNIKERTPRVLLTNKHKHQFKFPANYQFEGIVEAVHAKTVEVEASLNASFIHAYPSKRLQIWHVKNPKKQYMKFECVTDGFSETYTNHECTKEFILISKTGQMNFSDSIRFCGGGRHELLVTKSDISMLVKTKPHSTHKTTCLYQIVPFFQKITRRKKRAADDLWKILRRDLLSKSSKTCECGVSMTTNFRIVGGENAALHEFPWQAALGTQEGAVFCGGALINDRYVLTAAHCTHNKKASELIVLLGDHDLLSSDDTENEVLDVKKITNHPGFSFRTGLHDISLLELERPVEITSNIRPACFASPANRYVGSTATVSGWGAIVEGGAMYPLLQKVDLPMVSLDYCKQAFGWKLVLDTSLCVGIREGGKDSCQGDSGGPLVWKQNNRRYLIGIVSYGFGCALPDTPSLYTRVDRYYKWILENTKDAKYCVDHLTSSLH